MRLLVDISDHGLGHLSQTVPIVDGLRRRRGVEILVRSGIDPAILRARLGPDIRHVPTSTGFGLVMKGALEVDRQATLDRYRSLHAAFARHVDEIADLIRAERCDAVFSNISYLSLAAARRAGVPSLACSSLNWSDVFWHYCGELPGAAGIREQMAEAYASADMIARLSPGMPMERFETVAVEQPIARVGRARRADLASILGLGTDVPLVLCAFGGMLPGDMPPFLSQMRQFSAIGPAPWKSAGAIPAEGISMPFEDLIASVDLVVSKPGYGIVAELGCSGTPSVLVTRNDWPEEPYLVEWLAARSDSVLARDLGALDAAFIEDRLKSGTRVRPVSAGGEQAVIALMGRFGSEAGPNRTKC